MEYLEGGSLTDLLGNLTEPEIAYIVHEILAGLKYIHSLKRCVAWISFR